MSLNYDEIAEHVRAIIELIGEDPDREGLRDTPMRVAKAYEELFAGVGTEPEIARFKNEEYNQLIVLSPIPFVSMCEHHLVPFHGFAHVGYLPGDYYVGLSKVVRVVEHYSKRPQVQERLTQQIAEFLDQNLETNGTMVVMEATHMCMTIRGVRTANVMTTTAAIEPDPLSFPKEEMMAYIQRSRT